MIQQKTVPIESFKRINPELGEIKDSCLDIKLNKDKVIKMKPYPIEQIFMQPLKEELERLLELKVIRRSDSEFGSAAFVLPKKNEGIRIIID